MPDWLPSAERGGSRLVAAADTVATIARDPGLLVDAVVDPIVEDWNNGNYGEAIGRGATELLLAVVGTKGIDKAAKGARVAHAADAASDVSRSGRAARATDTASDASRTSRMAPSADDTVDAGRAADATRRSAEEVNATFPDSYKPPYQAGTRVTEFTTTVDERFVRVHGADNRVGAWVMKREEIEGLSPEAIARKYSLPDIPTHVSEVRVPAGTRVRMGQVAANFEGDQGAVQYQLLQRIPGESFSDTRPIMGSN